MLKYIVPIMTGMLKSLDPIGKNPPAPKKTISEPELKELETYVLNLGASSVGYTPVAAHYVFKNKGILHANAIVMSMEMDEEGFKVVPSFACEVRAGDGSRHS